MKYIVGRILVLFLVLVRSESPVLAESTQGDEEPEIELGMSTVIPASTLYNKLKQSKSFKTRNYLGLAGDGSPCEDWEAYQIKALARCERGILFKADLSQGCWGGSGYGAWDAGLYRLGYVTPDRVTFIEKFEGKVLPLSKKSSLCAGFLLRVNGEFFDRWYPESGFAKYDFSPATNRFVPDLKQLGSLFDGGEVSSGGAGSIRYMEFKADGSRLKAAKKLK